ncbi:MAG: phosphatase PAP2 family protein [Oleiphilaceae bacterium]|nr:phosphatase PAP2 family protein [Oleiphilaceae bacterium]
MPYNKTSVLINKFYHWDISGCLFFNHFCHKQAVKNFFSMISRLGDGVFWYSFALCLPFIYGQTGLLIALNMVICGLLCLLLYRQLKTRLVRERPFIRSKDILRGCAPLDRYSFPSGHTMHAFCFSTIALWQFPEFWPLLVPFTLLVAVSRMVLGLHYPSDVLCGAIIGVLMGATANYLSMTQLLSI